MRLLYYLEILKTSIKMLLTCKIDVLGAGTLPGPVRELHAVQVTNHSVTLIWEAPADNDGPKPSGYEVRFKNLDADSSEKTGPQVRIRARHVNFQIGTRRYLSLLLLLVDFVCLEMPEILVRCRPGHINADGKYQLGWRDYASGMMAGGGFTAERARERQLLEGRKLIGKFS